MSADELLHLVRHAAQQQQQDYRPFVYGHVASYDPELHRVRCVVPSLRDESGRPTITPWMPLGSLMVGNGFGVQWAPTGGATVEIPTGGEQVEIHVIERANGISLAAMPTFNQVMLPPFPSMAAGDFGIKSPSGSYFYLAAGGNISRHSETEITDGNLNDTVYRLLNELAATVYNGHTHPTPSGTSSAPNQQMGDTDMTAILKAN